MLSWAPSSSLLSSALRYRCYDVERDLFYEHPSLICSSTGSGRLCHGPNSTCVDSGAGAHSSLSTGGRDLLELTPFFLRADGQSVADLTPRPIDANPPYMPHFDSFPWAVLTVFEVWAGVGWTQIMYYVADAQGRMWEGVFMIM